MHRQRMAPTTIRILGIVLASVTLWSAKAQAGVSNLRIATWNIQSVGVPGTGEYQASLDILNRIGADIVMIQEVASPSDVGNFESLALEADYPFTVVPPSGPFGASRSAVMSRIPFAAPPVIHTAAELSGDPLANDMTRYVIEIAVDVRGVPSALTLVMEHWKSGTADSDEFRRAVESRRVLQAVAGADLFVILGDVNEEISAVPQEPALFQILPPDLPAGFVLGTDLALELAEQGIVNDPFANLGAVIPLPALQLDQSDATHPASGRRLDYILFSQNAAEQQPMAEAYDSMDEGLPGGLPKFGDPLTPATSSLASDHLLVFADLSIAAVGCTSDADCSNAVLCDGAEICDATGLCRVGTPVDCDDGDRCTLDACEEATGMCVNAPPPPPGEVINLMVDASDLSWDPEATAAEYDVLRGDLSVLRGSSGDFGPATSACLADAYPLTALPHSTPPAVSGGFWYLVRAGLCGQDGTYDAGFPSQVGARDAEIVSSSLSCP